MKYVFILIGETTGGMPGEAKREVTVNKPPDRGAQKYGQCTAEPLEGEPCNPIFTLSCEKFEDDDQPLQYEFFYSKGKGSKKETLGGGFEAKRSQVAFPSGIITLYAKISDSLGASEMFEFKDSVKVIHRWR